MVRAVGRSPLAASVSLGERSILACPEERHAGGAVLERELELYAGGPSYSVGPTPRHHRLCPAPRLPLPANDAAARIAGLIGRHDLDNKRYNARPFSLRPTDGPMLRESEARILRSTATRPSGQLDKNRLLGRLLYGIRNV